MLLNSWGRAVPQHQSPNTSALFVVPRTVSAFGWKEPLSLPTYLPTYLVELPANDRSSPPPPVAPLPASFFPFLWLCYNNTCLLMCALFLCRRRRRRPFHNMLYRYIQNNNNDNATQRNATKEVIMKPSCDDPSIHPSTVQPTATVDWLTDWLSKAKLG